MRMWMIDPAILCRKHLLGEHGEIHKHIPSFRKGHKIDGRFEPVVQIQLNAIEDRHHDLQIEMLNRGYNHNSPLVDLPDFEATYPQHYEKEVDENISIKDLAERCPECRNNLKKRGWI
jgi:hypothetical protein